MGNDELYGGNGNDFLEDYDSGNFMDGGNDVDVVSYSAHMGYDAFKLYYAVDNGAHYTLVKHLVGLVGGQEQVDVLKNIEEIQFTGGYVCTIDESSCLIFGGFGLDTVDCPSLGANPFTFESSSPVCYDAGDLSCITCEQK